MSLLNSALLNALFYDFPKNIRRFDIPSWSKIIADFRKNYIFLDVEFGAKSNHVPVNPKSSLNCFLMLRIIQGKCCSDEGQRLVNVILGFKEITSFAISYISKNPICNTFYNFNSLNLILDEHLHSTLVLVYSNYIPKAGLVFIL